jgi:hypothetical protein
MRCEVFNLKVDPGEKHDLSAEMPGKMRELRLRLQNWRKGLGAAMPSANPDYRAESGKLGK